MKSIKIFTFAIFIIFSFTLCKGSNNFEIHLHLDENKRGEDQWAYLISLITNELTVVDSCKINKKDSTALLKGNITTTSVFYIRFSKMHSGINYIAIIPNEKIDIFVNDRSIEENIPSGYPAHDEYKAVLVDGAKIRDYYNQLIERLSQLNSSDSIEANTIRDSLKYYKEYAIQHRIEQIKEAKFATTASLALSLIHNEISDSLYNSMVTSARERFPNDRQIEDNYNLAIKGIPYPPMSENSKLLSKRLMNMLLQGRKSDNQPSKNIQSEDNILTDAKGYKLGDIIEDSFWEKVTYDTLTISQLKTPYILIDVWASWCAPCRKEVPNLKNLQNTYKNSISIVAISIDENKASWEKAILIDDSSLFKHTRIKDEERNYFYKKTKINAIPANFLLDKDRKIIAVDLRGEELVKKWKNYYLNKLI